jgi:hypothetical protein
MKYILQSTWFLLLFAVFATTACKKKTNEGDGTGGTVTTGEFVFNNALKKFVPDSITGNIISNDKIAVVFYYLQRGKLKDTLIQTDYLTGKPADYHFKVSPTVLSAWAAKDMSGITGVRILIRNDNMTSFDGIAKINYFNPAAPKFTGFPATKEPAMPGLTAITGNVTSEAGIAKIYFYDDLTGSFTVVDSIAGNSSTDLAVNYNYNYRLGAKNMRVEAVDIYGTKSFTTIVFVNVPFNPNIIPDAASIFYALPDGKTEMSGAITTFTNIASIKVYRVVGGAKTDVTSTVTGISVPVPAAKTVNFAINNFPYISNTNKDSCFIEVTDDGGRVGVGKIELKERSYYLWTNRTFQSQGTYTPTTTEENISTSCFFIGRVNQPLIGSCDVVGNTTYESEIDVLAYTTTAPAFTFYNPNNSGSIRTNYKCSSTGNSWAPVTILNNFTRVLLNTTVANGQGVYTKYTGGACFDDLSDAGLFSGTTTPSSNTAKFDNHITTPVGTGVFDPDPAQGAYLIRVKASKNILIKVTSATIVASPLQGKSFVICDIYKEK